MEKPGISAYNKLKGPVMEFGYVTESGDKVRVRSMPADGLDHMAIQRHLKYVEQEYVDESKTLAAFAHTMAGGAKAAVRAAGAPARAVSNMANKASIKAADALKKSAQRGLEKTAASSEKSAASIAKSREAGKQAWQQSGPVKTVRAVKNTAKAVGYIAKHGPDAVAAGIEAGKKAAADKLSRRSPQSVSHWGVHAEDTTYTRREVRKTRLLEAIRKYGDTDA